MPQITFCRRTGRSDGDYAQVPSALWYISGIALSFYNFLVDCDPQMLRCLAQNELKANSYQPAISKRKAREGKLDLALAAD